MVLMVWGSVLQAQCVPDTSSGALYSPSESEGLPSGKIGAEYEAIISVNVPDDTTVLTFTGSVDSLVLTDVTGLPPGFQYECNVTSCAFPGGTFGCIRVYGQTNDNANAGTWDLSADFTFHIKPSGLPAISYPYSLEGYSIQLDSIPLGVNELNYQNLDFFIEPNPLNERSALYFELPASQSYSVDVYSLLGAKVFHVSQEGAKGQNRLMLGDLIYDPGVYFISLQQGEYKKSMRFIVQ